MVVRPPAMLPLVGCDSERSSTLCAWITSSSWAFQVRYHFSPTSGLMARALARCSAPVISEVSPNTPKIPCGMSLSYMLPTVGHEARPVVVSDSPHLVDIHRSETGHSSRVSSEAHCRKSLAARDALAMVPRSPVPSMPKPVTGFPVAAMPSTTRLVQPSSMPITITAATLGLDPVPIRVRKCRSRSSPNCRRPYACGNAMVPLMLWATASHAALERSSSGRTITWLRTPTRPFSRRHPVIVPLRFALLIAITLPALGLEIVHVHVLALLDALHEAPDVLAVLDRRVAVLEVGERDLVADRNVVLHRNGERRVVLGDDAERLGAGREALDHHHGHIVLRAVRQHVRDLVGSTHRQKALPLGSAVTLGRYGAAWSSHPVHVRFILKQDMPVAFFRDACSCRRTGIRFAGTCAIRQPPRAASRPAARG